MNKSTILIILAILPVILICRYIYKKDSEKEPMKLLMKFFFLGIISCFLVVFISEIMETILPFMNKDTAEMTTIEIIIYTFIGVALVEEFCKWIMVYKLGYNHKEFDQMYDMIVYATFVSLGFACYENILYVILNNSISIGIIRGLLSVPAHACDAVFMGYYLCMAKINLKKGEKKLEKKNKYKSIFVPAILHGIYDYCLVVGHLFWMGVVLIFAVNLYINSIKKIKQISKRTEKL